MARKPAKPDDSPRGSALALVPAPPAGSISCPGDIAPGTSCVPALTVVKLVVRSHVGSKISTSGEAFEIELAEPIAVNGQVVVPAGARGKGEVVHAKKSGGSGASGELVLAARYLEIDGRQMRLRSMNFAQAGQDKMGTVEALNIASAVSVPGLSLIGFFVKGKGIDVPDGTMASAKTAEAFVLAPAVQPGSPLTTDPASQPQQGKEEE